MPRVDDERRSLKVVTEPGKVWDDVERGGNGAPHTLHVLDEPTVGLHMADVKRLIRVLHRLVDAGYRVKVIEHALDVIDEADWVIDLGREGGVGGGMIVGESEPKGLMHAASQARHRRPRSAH